MIRCKCNNIKSTYRHRISNKSFICRPVSKEHISNQQENFCDINQNIDPIARKNLKHVKQIQPVDTNQQIIKMAIDVRDVTNSDVAQIITGSEHINKMASSLTTNESIARLVEDFVINNIGSIAEKIADSIQLRNRSENQGNHNQIIFCCCKYIQYCDLF